MKRQVLFLSLSGFALGLVFFLQVGTGSASIDWFLLWKGLLNWDFSDVSSRIVLLSRTPAALCSLLAGGALAISGLQMQTVLSNPVAGPYVLGISSGAGLGVALLTMGASWIGLEGLLSSSSIALASGLGAFLAFGLIFMISVKTDSPASLLIIGMMLGGVSSALIQLLQLFSEANDLRNYTIWSFASFRGVSWSQLLVLAFCCLIGLLIHFRQLAPLNALLLGEEYAATLGVNVRRTRILVMISSALLAGSVTAFCGPVGFVGLATPHIARMIFHSADHWKLSVPILVLGALIAGLCNWIGSIPGIGFNMPVNVLTSILGAPFVIWLVLKRRV